MVQGEFLMTVNTSETTQSTTHPYHNPGQAKGEHHV
jgi:hypothetical protein